ncbi:hypothetical protein VTK56DRAFT_9563 [Thermocarpiscus australiensis]
MQPSPSCVPALGSKVVTSVGTNKLLDVTGNNLQYVDVLNADETRPSHRHDQNKHPNPMPHLQPHLITIP